MNTVKPPHVGMRTFKTALATAFCALIYYFTDRSPAFACIGVIFGMGANMEDAKKNGGNRLFGTIIGGVIGILLFKLYLVFVPDGRYTLLLVPFVFVGTVLLVMLCQMFWVGGVQPGGVVLCILLFNTPAATYVQYAMNRIFDTAVGVIIALVVSYVFPRGWMQLWPVRMRGMRAHAKEAWISVRSHGISRKK
ncbi:MAG: aromatic acid exporter family protein [Eubacteriales bacterium]|nr:aromatic acid exporter family protein [Eubacteriales bacterium]